MNDIRRVIDNAEDHNERYGLLTAHHNSGWMHLRDSDHVGAERCFMQMLYMIPRGDEPLSWWHRMAGWFGLGATLYMANQQNYEKAIKFCLMAEYVSAMLGLRVDVTRGVTERMLPEEVLLSPSALIKTIGMARTVSRDKMEALRQRAIIETGLQIALAEEISARPYEKRPR